MNEMSLQGLKTRYADQFWVGSAVNLRDMEGARLAHLKQHFNLLTCENAMKPESLYDGRGLFDTSAADQLVARILDEGFLLHGHVLVWHAQSPSWLWSDASGAMLSCEAATENMRAHITRVMRHFGDKVVSWDVVNEALDGDWVNPEDWRRQLRDSGWLRAMGSDFVEVAFRIAREVADELGLRDLPLIYNDYNDDEDGKSLAMAAMVREINARYLEETGDTRPLISGIGMQGHYNRFTNPDNVRRSLERFAALGIPIAVTELDVTLEARDKRTDEDLAYQAGQYARIFQAYQDHASHISRVTFWGVDDGSSWRGDRSPLLFDGTLAPKPAYAAVMEPMTWIERYPTLSYEARVPEVAFDESGTLSISVNTPLSAWEGASGRILVKRNRTGHGIHLDVTVLDRTVDAKDAVVFYFSDGDLISEVRCLRCDAKQIEDGYHFTVEMVDVPRYLEAKVLDYRDGVHIATSVWADRTANAPESVTVMGRIV